MLLAAGGFIAVIVSAALGYVLTCGRSEIRDLPAEVRRVLAAHVARYREALEDEIHPPKREAFSICKNVVVHVIVGRMSFMHAADLLARLLDMTRELRPEIASDMLRFVTLHTSRLMRQGSPYLTLARTLWDRVDDAHVEPMSRCFYQMCDIENESLARLLLAVVPAPRKMYAGGAVVLSELALAGTELVPPGPLR